MCWLFSSEDDGMSISPTLRMHAEDNDNVGVRVVLVYCYLLKRAMGLEEVMHTWFVLEVSLSLVALYAK